ncbi:prenyltransferase [Actinoplanes hulinensis]|uniref:Prenyltransferase n=1 Tax=Actinoplanes hulinensis TaxID=1144547 RepID=A0ABS7B1M0_9ACTN|nr:prenyltransferase [Actinoplanes hulinensis]MBW6434880.1 prenyltransferase [Actinoplanes hulinensis]
MTAVDDTRAAPPRSRREVILAFIRLARLKFLLESLITVALGMGLAALAGEGLRWREYLLAQVFISGTHLMTHFCNEYFDWDADNAHASPTAWTGGSRVLTQGLLTPTASLSAAFVALFAMIAVSALMPSVGSRLTAVLILALAWFYTAPPVRLNYRALGEVTTAAVLTLLTPGLVCYLQAGRIPVELPAVCVPLFLVMSARMMVMNLCDHEADLAVGKHTVPNRLGPRRAVGLIAALNVVAYLLLIVVTIAGVLPRVVGVAVLLTAPLAYWLVRGLLDDPLSDPARSNAVALRATLHAASTGFAATLGVLIQAGGDPLVGALLVAYLLLFTVLIAGVRRRA